MNLLQATILTLTGIGLVFTALTLRVALGDCRLIATFGPARWNDVELIIGRREARLRRTQELLRFSKHVTMFAGALWWAMEWPGWIEVRSFALGYVSVGLMVNSALGLYVRRENIQVLRERSQGTPPDQPVFPPKV